LVFLRYDEVDNIRPLTERLFKATKSAGLEVELLIMDDESKGTAQTEAIVKTLQVR
jgi:dolichol-phosphate mannosyltransferase